MEVGDAPSAWLLQQRDALLAAAALGPAVDLACGRGRNACAVASWGIPVIGLDRSRPSLAALQQRARHDALPVQTVCTDLETGRGIPLAAGRAGAVLVFRYLHRPLAPAIAALLAPGGLLLYETFTIHQRDLGHGPRNPAFLLNEGELPRLFPTLQPIAVWEGTCDDGTEPAALARLAAR